VPISEETKPVTEATARKTTQTVEKPRAVSAARVSVDRLQIRPAAEGPFLEYAFIIKNVDPQGRRMKGYTFVVLHPRQDSQAEPAVSPKTPLDGEMPANYKKGKYFSIIRFKPVEGTFPDTTAIEPFETATVYVYSETGSLLADHVYQVDALSGS
jgi:hypothetical protein